MEIQSARGHSESCEKNAERQLRLFFAFAEGACVSEVTPDHGTGFLERNRKEGLSAKSLLDRYTIVKALMKILLERRHVVSNSCEGLERGQPALFERRARERRNGAARARPGRAGRRDPGACLESRARPPYGHRDAVHRHLRQRRAEPAGHAGLRAGGRRSTPGRRDGAPGAWWRRKASRNARTSSSRLGRLFVIT